MKFYKMIPTVLAAAILAGCAAPQSQEETMPTIASVEATASQHPTEPPVPRETEFSAPESTSAVLEETQPTANTQPDVRQDTVPVATQPPATVPSATGAPTTEQPETSPPATEPSATEPPTTEAPVTEAPSTEPPETEVPATEPEETAPQITYEYKRQVAAYAAQYINQYRGSPCTVLSGMSQVAQYRASQLTWNYSHSTADKRAALAYYEYGRYIDATEFGDDASNSYWEADTAEAICAGFKGVDAETMGRYIADMLRNSSSHWSYISSSEYSYIGVGVDYREGSQYGWYACIMVGKVNYG